MARPHLQWALAYAKLGWRVHPCRPGEKLPILQDWPKRATTDRDLIERWWGRSPTANIATATGPGSGIFALDVDGPEGERALVDLERRHGPMPELYVQQWTGSGHGWQGFFTDPAGRTIRNSAGRLGPKLDTRGDGGYVVLPPSLHPSGNRYRWAPDRAPDIILPEPAPAWLVELLDPPPQPEAERSAWSANAKVSGDDRYIEKALITELKLTARAPEGERNAQLFESAVSLLRFVADHRLPKAAVTIDLRDAAINAGLTTIEIDRTIKSAASRRGITL
jgi:Bifunctional DNA primase/polymerase, N-terminal